MKAILMRVNYDTKYTNPHKKQSSDRITYKSSYAPSKSNNDNNTASVRRSDEKQKDLPTTRQGPHRNMRDTNLQNKNHAKFDTLSSGSCSPLPSKCADFEKIHAKIKQYNSEVKTIKREDRLERHKEGVAKAHTVIRLKPLTDNKSSPTASYHGNHLNRGSTSQIQRLLDGPYMQKVERRQTTHLMGQSTNHSPTNTTASRKAINLSLQTKNAADKGRYSHSFTHQHPSYSTTSFSLEKNSLNKHASFCDDSSTYLTRSKTVPFERTRFVANPVRSAELISLERRAKVYAERAVRNKKIFSIVGPYPALRNSLRRRGWVEKFLNGPPLQEPKSPRKSAGSDDDLSDDDNKPKDGKIAPWEEENGKYNLMSHIVREVTPSFVWTVKAQDTEIKFNKSGQIVNHFANARSLTTKVGLVSTMKNVPWYDTEDPDTFFPRCYRLNNEDEREEFIDDYRITACIGILKWIVENYHKKQKEGPDKENVDNSAKKSDSFVSEQSDASSRDNPPPKPSSNTKLTPTVWEEPGSSPRKPLMVRQSSEVVCSVLASPPSQGVLPTKKSKSKTEVHISAIPAAVLTGCIERCDYYLKSRDHCDIDSLTDIESSCDTSWDQIILWFYRCVLQNAPFPEVTSDVVSECEELLERMREVRPQHDLDGIRNVWIIKPGSLSRGRGIACCNKLEEILLRGKDESYVAQKYIESPLLIHNTKFDIRQWFLVTDWNPLTVWFYKDSYMRFCSQEYTLDDFHESIHLANNSVQKHFKNGVRSEELPDDNMWSSDEFQDYLRGQGHSDVWRRQIYAGMKHAVVTVLVASQESVESRRCAFALYGADFMVTEDFRPWLLEINSSPTMARNTRVTNKLCVNVLEDTIKVVLDRKQDRNTSTGRFELIYKQQHIGDPPPTDITMAVLGKAVRKKPQPAANRDKAPTQRSPARARDT